MQADKPKTVTDLLASPDERVELIGGHIVRRPMPRGAHDRVVATITDPAPVRTPRVDGIEMDSGCLLGE